MKNLEKSLGIVVYVIIAILVAYWVFGYAVFGYNSALWHISRWLYVVGMLLLAYFAAVKMCGCKKGSTEWVAWIIVLCGIVLMESHWLSIVLADGPLAKGYVFVAGSVLFAVGIVVVGLKNRETSKMALVAAIVNSVIFIAEEIYYKAIIPGMGYEIWSHRILPCTFGLLDFVSLSIFLFCIVNPQAQEYGPNVKLRTKRGWFKYVALSALTFGIYGIVVMSHVSREINRVASGRDGRHTMHYCLIFFLFGPLTLQIATLVWFTKICNRMGAELKARGIDFNFGGADYWLWNILGSLILVGPFIFLHRFFKSMNLINRDYNEKGLLVQE